MNIQRTLVTLAFSLTAASLALTARGEPQSLPRGEPDAQAAARGYAALTSMPYTFADPIFTLSPRTFANLSKIWPDDWRGRMAAGDAASLRKLAFERYGLVEAPYDNHGAPMGFVSDAGGRWRANCLACHSGAVAGRTIIGRPSARLDINTLIEDIIAYRERFGDYADLSRTEKLLFKTTASEVRRQSHVGSFAGMFDIWSVGTLEAKLHTNGLHRFLRLGVGSSTPHEVDAPAWWNVKWKTRYGWDGFAPLTSRVIMLATLTLENSPGLIKSWDDQFKDVLQYIDSIEPPKYPGAIDSALAARGRKLFESTCAHCHGTYGPDAHYPQRLVSLNTVGTDPIRATTGLPAGYKAFIRDSWLGDFGKADVHVAPANGYIAPPLHGIWASAPYFHNGSAPTLYDVLYPAKRPKVWHVKDADAYDWDRVGMQVEELDEVPAGLRPDQQRRYYDTRAPGKSGAGHDFADDFGFDDSDKTAVLEYLKTL